MSDELRPSILEGWRWNFEHLETEDRRAISHFQKSVLDWLDNAWEVIRNITLEVHVNDRGITLVARIGR